MLTDIIFLTPIYISFFWTFVLAANNTKKITPRHVLSFFMFLTFLVYIGHSLYFLSFKNIYAWFDPIYQWSSLSVYPAYYIYIRLLTADSAFSIRKHSRILIIPTFCLSIYLIGIAISPWEEYKIWLFSRSIKSETFGIQLLQVVFQSIKITLIVTIAITAYEDIRLIKKYKSKVLRYFSNIKYEEIKIRIMTILTFIAALSSITKVWLGREFFVHTTGSTIVVSVVFSSLIFFLGYLGNQQKPLHTVFESFSLNTDNFDNKNHTELFNKIIEVFEKDKCYLDPNLTIATVAKMIGSNRTYISKLVNNYTDQSFSHFANGYRIKELEETLKNKTLNKSLKELAFDCGFGSVDSMKRAVNKKTNLSFDKWRNSFPMSRS